ncbi:hypothetical protein ACWN6Y_08240 [Vagococcus teuberi]|uniref:Uncharacterized protein n=1 Tax=Vagococcus teuberi TaxID=519472 RepID=A0A1J0A3A2_9ENTE|nr:hypothetical protein [Vagococcus teuberi]APB30403.1 hypothetical protein BHY08_00195 [Vagococcus teuberi]
MTISNAEKLKGMILHLKKLKEDLLVILEKDSSIMESLKSDQYEGIYQNAKSLVKQLKEDFKKHPEQFSAEELNYAETIEHNVVNLGHNLHEISTNISAEKRKKLTEGAYLNVTKALEAVESM